VRWEGVLRRGCRMRSDVRCCGALSRRGRVAALLFAVLLAAGPPPARADVRLGGPLVALAAGPGAAYAVVAGGERNAPFRLVRSGGRRVARLGAFGSRGAEFADVAAGPDGPVAAFARPTSDGFEYESTDGIPLGEGTGPMVLALDGDTRVAAYPDEAGDIVLGTTRLTDTGPALRHAPLDVAGGLVLDLVQSRTRSELRVLGAGAPAGPVASARGLGALSATVARDDTHVYVAYRAGNRLTLARAPARPTGRWSRRRLRVRGELNGAPSIARAGRRTIVATSQRVRGRRSIHLTTAGPAGTFLDRLTRPRGSDLAPLVATGPDGRVYVAWTRRADGRSRRFALLRRVL
jgi:hypothetical protein